MLEAAVILPSVLPLLAIFGVFIKGNNGALARKKSIWLVMPGAQLAAVLVAIYYGFEAPASPGYWATLVVVALLCSMADALLLLGRALVSTSELAEEKIFYLKAQVKLQRLYNRRYRKNLEEARELKRDIVRMFARTCNSIRNEEGLDAELARLNMEAKEASGQKLCDNPVVDAVLKLKLDECEARGIRTEWRVTLPSSLNLPSVDLCALFSNLVDNAMHACEKLEPGNRFVDVRARVTAGRLAVETVNTCDETVLAKPRHVSGFLAMPSELPEHGWGFSILRSIAWSNDGSFETSVETREGLGRVFRVTIILRLGGGSEK